MATVITVSCAAGAVSASEVTSIDATKIQPFATGSWSSESVSVPGTNGSVYTSDVNVKQTKTKRASFKVTERSEKWDLDARLINSDNDSRSSWARDLPTDQKVTVGSSASKGYEYGCEISSDLRTWGSCTATIKWSADPM